MMRVIVLSTLVVVGLSSAVWSQATQPAPPSAAPPAAPNPENFTGKVTPHPTTDIRTLRYSFEPGARTNWHSHEGGQVIHIEKGNMLAQEAGGPVKEYVPRQTMTTAPGVKHWHGALPNQPLTQVAMSFGTTNWMEKVTDAQYSAGAKK